LTNAVKFTESGGDITVGWCLKDDGSLNLCVEDTGEGMLPESIAIALEPFGQVATSLTRNHEGAGLGLPLSRRLAELHNASLSIESTLGQGTFVRILLPSKRVIEKSTV